MTDIELINNYILGEKENIECLLDNIERFEDVKIKNSYEQKVIDTTVRISQLESIINKLNALEIIMNKVLTRVEFKKEIKFTIEEFYLLIEEFDLLNEVLEEGE